MRSATSGRCFALAVTTAFILAACRDLTAPLDDYVLPEPDLSLDPARLSVGDFIATPCAFGRFGDGLAHLRERHEWATVDVFFGRTSPDGPWGAPTAEDIALVSSHGGRVLYSFNIPAVRARMILSRVPDLVRDGDWITVRGVPNDRRYDVPLTIGFTRAVTDSDAESFANMGGRVTHIFSFNALAGTLPDRSIPAFQSHPDVTYIQAESVLCVASARALDLAVLIS